MLRKTFFALMMVMVAATTSQAAIMLQASLSAVQPTLPSASGPLVAYDLRAVSDSGQSINTVANPTTFTNVGMGLHQVWAPFAPAGTPTRGDQVPPLWNDAWLPYDSYWLFAPSNSLSAGGAFTETNDGAGGVVPGTLPPGAAGPPTTGFGQFGFATANASKLFTIGSGLADSDVTFAQLVMKATDSVLVSMGVLDTTGARTDFDDFCVGASCGILEEFEVDDFADHGYLPGALITGGPLPTNATDADILWALESFEGPGGAVIAPENLGSVDPITGVFSWQSMATSPLGGYTATIRGTNAGDPLGSDTGLFTFNLVPEPASITLLGLAMVGFGFIRRR